MPGSAAGKASQVTDVSTVGRKIVTFLHKRIWLPNLIYSAVPYFYILAGLAALLATVSIAEWFWVVPHYVLFSFACVHIGIIIFRRRRKFRASQTEASATRPD